MALYKQEQETVAIETKPKIYSEEYKHSIVESEFKPQYALYSNVAGIPIVGDYYRGYMGKDEEAIGNQPGEYAVYHSYTKIKRMVIKVDGEASFQFDPDSQETTESMMCYLFFDLTPIIGDLFIRDIGDGRAGLYQIVSKPEVKTKSAIKVYYAELKLLQIVTKEIEEELDSKVVNTLIYSADSLMNGGNAIITTEQYDLSKKLHKQAFYIFQDMLKNFYWERERTIAYQHTDGNWIYDPGLVNFIKDIVPSSFYSGHATIELPTYQTALVKKNKKTLDVWDVFRTNDFDILPFLDREYYLYEKSNFLSSRNYIGIVASSFSYLLINGELDFLKPIVGANTSYFYGTATKTSIKPPVKVDNYFSDSFYDGEPSDEFESFTLEFFRDKNVNREKLMYFCKLYTKWEWKDKLYRGAILICMILISRKVNRGW